MTSILVTNDDGYDAPGIQALAEAMRALGDVKICAPKANQSASGHKITLFQNIEVSRGAVGQGIPALAVGGSPADCIALSLLGLVDASPDIVVSGINRGENMGQDLTYSGTVTAALEAAIHGIPAVAFSLARADADCLDHYKVAAQIAIPIVKMAARQGLAALHDTKCKRAARRPYRRPARNPAHAPRRSDLPRLPGRSGGRRGARRRRAADRQHR